MGRVTSIAASPNQLLIINDQRLLFLDKREKFKIVYSYQPPERPTLLGYDIEYGDFWIIGVNNIYRINEYTYSTRYFKVEGASNIKSFAVGPNYLYWHKGQILVRFNKRNGKVEPTSSVPQEAKWFSLLTSEHLRQFPFLAPYYFQDQRFNHYPITALLEVGLDLYVGTSGFGIFKYNSLTWEKSHIAFSPYTPDIRKLLKEPEGIYFLGDNSISFYNFSTDSFVNIRFDNNLDAVIPFQNRFIINSANRLLSIEGNFVYPISEPIKNVTAFSHDGEDILFATRDGLYRLNTKANATQFLGLADMYIYRILTDSISIYAATEFGLYQYEREKKSWERLINLPFLDLMKFDKKHYLISFSHQLYELAGDSIRALPYMNINCFDSDGSRLYLGTSLGLAIYDPDRQSYRTAPYLPKDKINSIVVANDIVWLLTDRALLKIAVAELK